MLLELKVSRFAVIDKLEVHFLRPGLNILTGETGAGKSVLLKSLSLLLGGKGSSETIRSGNEQAEIEGAFDLSGRPDVKKILSDLDLTSEDDLLIVRRIINNNNKHRIYINGRLSTLAVLETIVPLLVEITGQHEHHRLVHSQAQLDLLDKFASSLELREKYSQKLSERNRLTFQLDELRNSMRDREQRMDFLRFQIEEIESFKPVPGEDQELSSQYQRAKFAAKLRTFAQNSEELLFGQDASLSSQVGELVRQGEALIDADGDLKPLVSSLKEISVLIEDAGFSFRSYGKKLGSDDDSSDLDRIAERLSDLKKLQRKYGSEIEEIINFKNTAKKEFETLRSSEEGLSVFEKQIAVLNAELSEIAAKLSSMRKKAAVKLSAGVNSELKDLNMKGAEFSIEMKQLSDLRSSGVDEVTFMIKPAAQEPARALSKVASGGELSRIMLALKQIVAMRDLPMTYLFDEVDTGVSGPTAEKVGKKLKSTGRAHQVICITHLPQVASFADAHFLISKEVAKGFVKSDVKELSQKERIQEVGRLISGEKITATSLAHAKQMLETSRSH